MTARRFPIPRIFFAVTVLVVIGAGFSSCASDPPVALNAPPSAAAEPRTVFIALGGDETLNRGLADGFRTSWTRKVFSTLPRSAVYVNLASEDATADSGNTVQTAKALELHPTVVTIWFGSGDQRANTSDTAFTKNLTQMVTRLRDSGARVLLLANSNDRARPHTASMIEQVATQTGVVYVAVAGPNRNPGDVNVQDAIAAAVVARIDH